MNKFLGKNNPKQEKIEKLSKNTRLISKEKKSMQTVSRK